MSLRENRKSCRHGEWKHAHQLELKSYQKTFTCDGCRVLGFGPRYRCDRCDYDLHEVCHEAQFCSMIISHDHFPGDTFEFIPVPAASPSGHRFCDACGKRVLGFVYHCKERGWDLHPCCSTLPTKIHVEGTDYVLHVGMGAGKKKCLWCKKRKLEGTKEHVPGWSFGSSSGDCRIHVYCLTEMVREACKKGELIHELAGSSGTRDEGSLMLVEWKPSMSLARKNGARRSGIMALEFLRKAELFVRTLVGLIFGDPTVVLATVFFQFLSQ